MKKLGFINKVIFFFNSIVAALLLLSYILPFVPPKTFPLIAVLSLGVPLLILINILFALYWIFKLKKQVLLSATILFIGYLSFGSIYRFSSSHAANTESSFSVMNYNVRLFNLYNWIDEDHVENSIENLIKTEAPDVLSMQEYHPHKNVDLSFYKHKFEDLSGNRTKYGQVIFSKFPIVNSGSIEFPDTANNAIFADVVKGNDTIRVYNLHLQSMHIDANVESLKNEDSERLFKRVGNTFKMQQFQAELFLGHKKQCPYKMIICGDFNNTAFSYVYKEIKGDLNDTYKEAGAGFGSTYDFKFFPIRIDFIFTDPDFKVDRLKTFEDKFSDHYPILAKLSLH